jgi:hypothetical protein
VEVGETPFLRESHSTQGRGNGSFSTREDGSQNQDLNVIPNRTAEERREGNQDFVDLDGQGKHSDYQGVGG